MREILFRGKDEYGVWHYGLPMVYSGDFVVITAPHAFDKTVIPETVGQYIGLEDKNGKSIFEGDILGIRNLRLMVYYDTDYRQFRLKEQGGFNREIDYYCGFHPIRFVVIGNIYDNPDLFERTKNDNYKENNT